jgi:hypothetical protein
MHCHEFEHRLNEVLDQRGRPEADTLLAEHARRCAGCGERLAAQRLVFAGLTQRAVPAPSAALARRAIAQVVHARPHRAPGRTRWWLAASAVLASAAAVLLAVSLVRYVRSGGPALAARHESDEQPAAGGRPRSRQFGMARPAFRTQRGAASQPDGAGSSLVAPPQSDWLIEAPRIPAHVRSSLDQITVSIPPAPLHLDHMEQLAPGLRPVRASLTIIWQTLCSALPVCPNSDQPPHPSTTGGQRTDLSSVLLLGQAGSLPLRIATPRRRRGRRRPDRGG